MCNESSTHRRGDEDRSFTESEVLQRLFALVLRTVSVYRLSWIAFLIEELLQLLGALLRLHKHQRQRVRTWT